MALLANQLPEGSCYGILARYEELRAPFDETARRIYGRLVELAMSTG